MYRKRGRSRSRSRRRRKEKEINHLEGAPSDMQALRWKGCPLPWKLKVDQNRQKVKWDSSNKRPKSPPGDNKQKLHQH